MIWYLEYKYYNGSYEILRYNILSLIMKMKIQSCADGFGEN